MCLCRGMGGEQRGYGTIRNPARDGEGPTREGGIGDLGSTLISGPGLICVGVWAVGRWAGSLDGDIRGVVRKPCPRGEVWCVVCGAVVYFGGLSIR